MSLTNKKKEDLLNLSHLFKSILRKETTKGGDRNFGIPKILDTSVIIDGRIFDICKTGFVEAH